VIYLFIGIAIVCDDFFVASLESICAALGLSDDVAGATFMAAGSSAPELAASAMSLINSSSDNALGVGTIVGSAVFNILVIIGTTVIFAGQSLKLDWKPMARDCTFYAAAICGIVGTFRDGKVDWWEGLIYVLLYSIYIAFMWKNVYFMNILDKKFGDYLGRSVVEEKMEQGEATEMSTAPSSVVAGGPPASKSPTSELSITAAYFVGFAAQRFKAGLSKREPRKALSAGQLLKIRRQTEKVTWNHHHVKNSDNCESTDGDDEDSSPFKLPAAWKDRPIWALSLPWYCAYTLTIPPCHTPKWKEWYFVSFMISIGWIGLISHFMVEWCARIGCILGIPAVVMGTTVLAAGTSIPDALSSISVAKDGFADMAVANAVGSNVFDIWLGLGLPWLCYLSWQTPNYILVSTTELLPSSLILLAVLVFYISTVAMRGFTLSKQMGYIYLGMYGIYAFYNILVVWVLDVYHLE
jgi:sodium/potassium/calcium exchanger 4